MAGRLIGVSVLRQFGLVDNEKVDDFLAAAFTDQREVAKGDSGKPKEARSRRDAGPLKSAKANR